LQKIEKLKQLLINKYIIYGTFVVWALLKSFAPIIHIDNSQFYFNIMPTNLAHIMLYIPIVALFYLVMYKNGTEKGKNIKLWKRLNINVFLLAGYIMLIAITILQIYSLNVLPIAARGSLLSWGMLVSLTMAITYKLRSMPSPIAILTAIIAAFWVIGFFEMPYQICRYYLSDYNLIMDTQNLRAVLVRQMLFAIPFILTFLGWRIKFTKTSLICLISFTMLWLAWLFIGDFRTLYIVDFSVSTTESILPEHINWLWYTIGKTCKTILAFFVLFLNYNNLAKGEKVYETIPNN